MLHKQWPISVSSLSLSLPICVMYVFVRERERDIQVQAFNIINNILSKFETIYNGSLY